MADKETISECMLSIEADKLEETYPVRIPGITKLMIDRLDKVQKKKLNTAILVTIAHELHEAAFNPNKYLKED